MKLRVTILIALISVLAFQSCKKSSTPAATIVKQWTAVAISPTFENPAPPGRSETGTADIILYSDFTLHYSATMSSLAGGDAIVAGHIHIGDPVTNGPIIVPLNPTFAANGSTLTASGTVTISSTLADSLQNQPIYINFHSTAFPGGLMRGQMDKVIDFATDAILVGSNEVPSVTTTATGKAYLRITTDKILYSKVIVSNLESTDVLSAAHIHKAVAGVNGTIIQGLCSGAVEFNTSKATPLSDALITSIKSDPIYVNAHSTAHPGGLIRGQVR